MPQPDPASAHYLREARLFILEQLYRHFLEHENSSGSRPLSEVESEVRSSLAGTYDQQGELVDPSPLITQALQSLTSDGFLRLEGRRPSASITVAGIRDLARHRPTTHGDLARQTADAMLQTAKLVEAREAVAEQIGEFESRLVGLEREFYGRVITILALFVAAFALIITGAQAAVRIPPGPFEVMFAQSAAIMLPIGASILLFILGAWLLARRLL